MTGCMRNSNAYINNKENPTITYSFMASSHQIQREVSSIGKLPAESKNKQEQQDAEKQHSQANDKDGVCHEKTKGITKKTDDAMAFLASIFEQGESSNQKNGMAQCFQNCLNNNLFFF